MTLRLHYPSNKHHVAVKMNTLVYLILKSGELLSSNGHVNTAPATKPDRPTASK